MYEKELNIAMTKEEKEALLLKLEFLEKLLTGMHGFFSENPDCAERAYDWFVEHDIPMEDLVSKIKETEL